MAQLWTLVPLRYLDVTLRPREKERAYDVTSLSVTGHATVEAMMRAHYIDEE